MVLTTIYWASKICCVSNIFHDLPFLEAHSFVVDVKFVHKVVFNIIICFIINVVAISLLFTLSFFERKIGDRNASFLLTLRLRRITLRQQRTMAQFFSIYSQMHNIQ